MVIDEIQRLPVLLKEVHRLIESRGIRFLLTGSSARKLRQGEVNLLGGRARTKFLHPLTSEELGERFDLEDAIERGTIPSIYFSDDPAADLEAYAGTYLQQEVVGFEVDFILGDHTAIEVKAKGQVSEQDLKPLRMLAEEGVFERYVCVCRERRARRIDGIQVVPFEEFFRALWGAQYA